MIVIADTTPINYLVLIGEIDLLPALFGQVSIPEAVFQELQAAATPLMVQKWITNPPSWLEIKNVTGAPDASLSHLDEGEREAIQLAEELGADLLLVDEKAARKEATKRHLATSGTLGVLDRAADKRLIDFAQAFQRLKQTSFYVTAVVEQFFLSRDAQRKSSGSKP
jgi:predicted nucleic acid-binding protein